MIQSNVFFAVDAQIVSLTITIEKEPHTTCLLIGSDIILTCEVIGYPRPTVNFRKNMLLIDSTQSFGITQIGRYQVFPCCVKHVSIIRAVTQCLNYIWL